MRRRLPGICLRFRTTARPQATRGGRQHDRRQLRQPPRTRVRTSRFSARFDRDGKPAKAASTPRPPKPDWHTLPHGRATARYDRSTRQPRQQGLPMSQRPTVAVEYVPADAVLTGLPCVTIHATPKTLGCHVPIAWAADDTELGPSMLSSFRLRPAGPRFSRRFFPEAPHPGSSSPATRKPQPPTSTPCWRSWEPRGTTS
jgi:hypothetical protein